MQKLLKSKNEEIHFLQQKVVEVHEFGTQWVMDFENQIKVGGPAFLEMIEAGRFPGTIFNALLENNLKERLVHAHEVGLAILARRRELDRPKNLQAQDIIDQGDEAFYYSSALADAGRMRLKSNTEDTKWYTEHYGFAPRVVWCILRVTRDAENYMELLGFHSAMKYFCLASSKSFEASDFKENFRKLQEKVDVWGRDLDKEGLVVPESMTNFFKIGGEGFLLHNKLKQ